LPFPAFTNAARQQDGEHLSLPHAGRAAWENKAGQTVSPNRSTLRALTMRPFPSPSTAHRRRGEAKSDQAETGMLFKRLHGARPLGATAGCHR
jgi:hypothetical protein